MGVSQFFRSRSSQVPGDQTSARNFTPCCCGVSRAMARECVSRASLSIRFEERLGKPMCLNSKLQSGSKTCHSTKKVPRTNFPKYVISTSTRKFPGIIFISIGRCQLDDFRGSPPGFCCGVPLNFLALRSQLKNSFELIFAICHLTFNLKVFWN